MKGRSDETLRIEPFDGCWIFESSFDGFWWRRGVSWLLRFPPYKRCYNDDDGGDSDDDNDFGDSVSFNLILRMVIREPH